MTEAQRLRFTHIAAFAAVYLIWGSTYLAIRIAIETLPGLLMSGVRAGIGGLVLYAIARYRGAGRPTAAHWRSATVIGLFLFLGGNGGVVLAEHWVPSGLAALFVGAEPLWVVLALAVWPGAAEKPEWRTLGALGLGFLGVTVLALSGQSIDAGAIPLLPLVIIILAPLAWAIGSLHSRRADTPRDGFQAAGMQMMAGGAALLVAGMLRGEAATFDPAAVSTRSLIAWVYLVVLGSIVAFGAYSYLLRTTRPTLVATYAYVNPIVAVFLGWLIAGEVVTGMTLIASTLIVGSVVLIGLEERRRRRRILGDGAVAGSPTRCVTAQARTGSVGVEAAPAQAVAGVQERRPTPEPG